MKLMLDGTKIDCTAWRVDAPEGGRVVWRFVTPTKQVWRVCLDERFPESRTKANKDTAEVRVISLLWPIEELSKNVRSVNTNNEKRGLVRVFISDLLYTYDKEEVFLQGTRVNRRNIPDAVIDIVCREMEQSHYNPNHFLCSKLLTLVSGNAVPGPTVFTEMLEKILKNWTARYAVIVKQPQETNWLKRCADTPFVWMEHCPVATPHEADIGRLDFLLFCSCIESDLGISGTDSLAFHNLIGEPDYVAVHHWPDVTLALPVQWVDSEPQAMDVEDIKLFTARLDAKKSKSNHKKLPHPIQCKYCGWIHDEALTRWEGDGGPIILFSTGPKQDTYATDILRVLHTHLKSGMSILTAKELEAETKYYSSPIEAFGKNHRKDYHRLLKVQDGHRSIRVLPKQDANQNTNCKP